MVALPGGSARGLLPRKMVALPGGNPRLRPRESRRQTTRPGKKWPGPEHAPGQRWPSTRRKVAVPARFTGRKVALRPEDGDFPGGRGAGRPPHPDDGDLREGMPLRNPMWQSSLSSDILWRRPGVHLPGGWWPPGPFAWSNKNEEFQKRRKRSRRRRRFSWWSKAAKAERWHQSSPGCPLALPFSAASFEPCDEARRFRKVVVSGLLTHRAPFGMKRRRARPGRDDQRGGELPRAASNAHRPAEPASGGPLGPPGGEWPTGGGRKGSR